MADTNTKNILNKITKNYPNNPLRPLEISQATYETLLLIYMNDMGGSETFFWNTETRQNNEYMKGLGTFLLGEPLGDYLWPKNWLKLLYEEFEDVKKWSRALRAHRVANFEKQYVGTVIEALTKRTVLRSSNFQTFLRKATNPVEMKYANKEAGSQKAFPTGLTTRRVLEALVIPYRTSGMDCNPMNPASNIDALKKWFPTATALSINHSTAFVSSMVDFYKANIFPDPELFLPYMIALSPSLRNAQLAIQEYEKFVTDEVTSVTADECCDPFLKTLTERKIPSIPNFEKNYLLLAEKFNFNRDYIKVAVGPVIQNMVLPIAVRFGVFSTTGTLADRRVGRYKAQRSNSHGAFVSKLSVRDIALGRTNGSALNFWHAQFKDLIYSYQNPELFYFPHWLYACSSRYIQADAALRDRDFVVINVENPKKRAYLVRWCNIKNYLTRDSCNLAVLMSKNEDDATKVNKMHLMAFEDYIQMIPRPQNAEDLEPNEKASFSNCFERVCNPNSNNAICYPNMIDAAPLPQLP